MENDNAIESLRFPVGKFVKPEVITSENLEKWIKQIAEFPTEVRTAVAQMADHQLDTTYRPNGWTVRQVVHHCADSHMNSFIRFKLALTEERPTIKPYFEERWAELEYVKHFSIESSLKILDGLHERWVRLLNSLSEQDLQRTFIHPEHGKEFTLAETIGTYAWHCKHHLAHIYLVK